MTTQKKRYAALRDQIPEGWPPLGWECPAFPLNGSEEAISQWLAFATDRTHGPLALHDAYDRLPSRKDLPPRPRPISDEEDEKWGVSVTSLRIRPVRLRE